MQQDRVIVVGAGPVGLVVATYLAGEGVPVLVIEAEQGVPQDLRASTFHPPTLDYLARFGIVEALHAQGRVCPLWQFRDRKQGAVATFDLGALRDETAYPYRLQCEQWKLTRLLRDRLAALDHVELRFATRVTEVAQDAGRVVVTVQAEAGAPEAVEGAYLIGADGARSVVRKAMGVAFDGMTMPEVFLSLSTTFPFHEAIPDVADIAYISDPDEWLTLLRTPSLWRVLFPTEPGETEEAMMRPERLEERLQAVVPSAVPYEVVHKTAYRVHERVAAQYVQGRIILAGDSAHLNNPLGGMGMNGGIHDAMNLGEKLTAVLRGADPALLGRYERQRRKIAIETVQAQALRNRQILNERDGAKRQAYYDDLRATADNPARHLQYVMRSSMLASLKGLEAVA